MTNSSSFPDRWALALLHINLRGGQDPAQYRDREKTHSLRGGENRNYLFQAPFRGLNQLFKIPRTLQPKPLMGLSYLLKDVPRVILRTSPGSFGGRVLNKSFGGGPLRRPSINLLRIEEELSAVHLRLSRIQIEHLSWQEFVKRYDRPQTFFYLDPPYYKAPYYNHNM